MTPAQRDKWDQRIRDYGFAVVACMAMAGAFVALGGWFSSKIATPLVESHREFLSSQVEIGKQQAETLKEVRQIVQTVSETEQKQTAILDDVRGCARRNGEVLEKLSEAAKVRPHPGGG